MLNSAVFLAQAPSIKDVYQNHEKLTFSCPKNVSTDSIDFRTIATQK